jgi:ABC-type uncharacterized transport system involved in gliding motility auxiliary subunit
VASGRYIKYTANSLVAILAVLAILATVNYITSNHKLRYDTTEAGRFSLSDQTSKVLKNLDREVKAYAFFQGVDRRMDDLFVNYTYYTDNFTYEFVDPDKKPELAKAFNIDRYNTVVITCGDREEKVEENTEQGVTNIILKVSRDEQKVIYFLEGHGERDLSSVDREGYSSAKEAMENENYVVGHLSLARVDSFPDDCSALVIASPQARLFDRELELIEGYLQQGGSVLMLLDPPPFEGFKGFLNSWGVEVGDNLVIDASGVGRMFGAGPTIPLVTNYEAHPITKGFRVMTFFPYARSVVKSDNAPSDVTVKNLCSTSKNSWADKEIEGEKFKFDEGDDTRGPISIATVSTRGITASSLIDGEEVEEEKKARLVVFGDADFVSNSYFSASGNADLFLNSINWLLEEEDLISIRPREHEDRRLTLTAGQTRRVFYLAVIFMPLAVICIGMIVWRRNR